MTIKDNQDRNQKKNKKGLADKYDLPNIDQHQQYLEKKMVANAGVVIFGCILIYYIYMASTNQNYYFIRLYLIIMLVSATIYYLVITKNQFKGQFIENLKANFFRLDERKKTNITQTLYLTTNTLFIIAFGVFIFKVFTSHSLASIQLEFGIILIFAAFLTFYPYLKKDYTLESRSKNKVNSKNDKKKTL